LPKRYSKNLNVGLVTSFEVSVPPLAEQERIVKLLDEADELRKLRAKLTAAPPPHPALFHEMFGQNKAGLPNGWRSCANE